MAARGDGHGGSGAASVALRVVLVEPRDEGGSRLEPLTAPYPGLEVTGRAENALDALAAIKSLSTRRRSAAIVSLALPAPRDAFWLIRTIRDRFPTVSILACDTGADEATISRAFFAGADGYVDTTAGAARFQQALRQVAAGELVLGDSSQPWEEEAVEEQEQATTEPDPTSALDEEQEEPASTAKKETPAVMEFIGREKSRRRWFGKRAGRERPPRAPKPAPAEPPARSVEPALPPPPPSPAPEPRPQPPTPAFEPRSQPAPSAPEPRPEPSPMIPAGRDYATTEAAEAVWAPGADWEFLEPPAAVEAPPQRQEVTTKGVPAPEPVWTPGPQGEAVREPEPEPPPAAEAEPEPEPPPAADAEPEPEPEPAPEPIPLPEPEPIPTPRPKPAAVVAVSASVLNEWDLQGMLGMRPEEVLILPSVIAAEEYLSENPDSGSVLVASPALKEVDAIGLADYAMRFAPATPVVLIREQSTDRLFQSAMRAGVREVADLSVGGFAMVQDAVQRAMAWSDGLRSARQAAAPVAGSAEGVVVTVFSSKGGTGKTFLASNLAAAVGRASGRETAILDLDLEMGDVFSYFGQETERGPAELMALADLSEPNDLLAAGTPLEQSLWGYASRSEPGGGTAISAEATGKLIRALRKAFTYTIVDSSASYSDHALTALELSDRILLITALDVTGMRHLSLAIDTLQSLGLPRERLLFVLNRADSKVDLSPTDVQEVMKLRVDARIPSSAMVPMSLNKGRPLTVEAPGADVSRAINLLAEVVVALHTSAAQRT